MVLIKVVQSIVDLWVNEIDIGCEANEAILSSSTILGAGALVIIADFEHVQIIGIGVEHVGEGSKDDEVDQHDAEPARPGRSDYQVAHGVIKKPLFS